MQKEPTQNRNKSSKKIVENKSHSLRSTKLQRKAAIRKKKRNLLPAVNWPNISGLSKPSRLIALLVMTALVTISLQIAHIPAALLLGPMISAILLSISEINLSIDTRLFTMAQGIIGCMIGQTITPSILHEALHNWPVFIAGVVSVILAAAAIGYFLARRQILPGTTAVWGSAAGGASAMVLMAESYDADVRLVAVMQYIRVVLVALIGAALAHFFSPSHVAAAAENFFPAFDITGLVLTIILAFGTALISRFVLHIPAGGVLVPFLITIILQNTGVFNVVLPPWLLAIFYLMIGWGIGLRFTRSILLHALALIPVLLASTLTLIFICAIFAVGLHYLTGVDFLTAYLATSPGGADSIAIIAASTKVDMPYVMAYQSVRFLFVTMTGPLIATIIAKHLGKRNKKLNRQTINKNKSVG